MESQPLEPAITQSVLLHTSVGALVVDLFGLECPNTVSWFTAVASSGLLCGAMVNKIHNGNLVQFVLPHKCAGSPFSGNKQLFDRDVRGQQRGMTILRTGVEKVVNRKRMLSKAGLLLFPFTFDDPENDCAFFLTLTNQNMDFLSNEFCVFGEVCEGVRTLQGLLPHMGIRVGTTGCPARLLRIKLGTVLLPERLSATELAHAGVLRNQSSAIDSKWVTVTATSIEHNDYHGDYLTSDEDESHDVDHTTETEERILQTNRAIHNILSGASDIDLAPPDNVLFVCNLNPLTTGDGLRTCFSQFGSVRSVDVLCDKSGRSKCYGFVEFEDRTACDRAFQKMNHALVDHSRIRVDYSQSVAKVSQFRERALRSSALRSRGEE